MAIKKSKTLFWKKNQLKIKASSPSLTTKISVSTLLEGCMNMVLKVYLNMSLPSMWSHNNFRHNLNLAAPGLVIAAQFVARLSTSLVATRGPCRFNRLTCYQSQVKTGKQYTWKKELSLLLELGRVSAQLAKQRSLYSVATTRRTARTMAITLTQSRSV